MFGPEQRYHAASCEANVLPNLKRTKYPDVPAAAFDTLWFYSGKGVIPQGYPDPEDTVRELVGTMEGMGHDHLAAKV